MSKANLRVYITKSATPSKRCQECGAVLAIVVRGKTILAGKVSVDAEDGEMMCHSKCPNCSTPYTFSVSDCPPVKKGETKEG